MDLGSLWGVVAHISVGRSISSVLRPVSHVSEQIPYLCNG